MFMSKKSNAFAPFNEKCKIGVLFLSKQPYKGFLLPLSLFISDRWAFKNVILSHNSLTIARAKCVYKLFFSNCGLFYCSTFSVMQLLPPQTASEKGSSNFFNDKRARRA